MRLVSYSMDMSLSKLWEMVKDRDAWRAAVLGAAESLTRFSDSTTRWEWEGRRGLAWYHLMLHPLMQRSAIPDPPTPSCYLRFSPPSEHWKSRPAGWELTNVCRWDSSKACHMSSSE